jgi:hypothetical protein
MKKILFIGLDYHNYTTEIIREFNGLGYDVEFYSIIPRTLYYKALNTISKAKYRQKLDAYHADIINKEAGNKYDVVFFLYAQEISVENLSLLKSQHSTSKFILYCWDSIQTKDYTKHLPYFDSAFTFDKEDAVAVNINYLPLFCIAEFQNLQKTDQHLNQIYFVGNIVTVARYSAIQKFITYCAEQKIHFKHFLKCTPVVIWRLLKAGFLPLNVSASTIAKNDFIKLIESSTTVFDFANHVQVGYTMRVMENLCAGKKIITNNARVLNEPFYTPDRILVIKDMDLLNIKSFLNTPLVEPDKKFTEYHLDSFLTNLLNG